MSASVSVVIPAYNAERTIGEVLGSLAAQDPAPAEVIVVDSGSTDRTAELAERAGARVIPSDGGTFSGGARNRGWDTATGDVVVFLDADAIPGPGFGAGLARALEEYPGAVVGCGRTFRARSRWGWVTHLQFETPYLPHGEPRRVAFVSSYCMAVPRDAPLRFDSSYGGEDGVLCIDALAAGIPIVFDPRFHAVHDDDRETFPRLRRLQRRRAYALARLGPFQREAFRKRAFSRFPVHYFALLRLIGIYRRLGAHEELRARFLRLLPFLVVAEWTLGWSAARYALRRPPLRGQHGGGFR
ncbi:MAG: glycosyltransferase family 2 protein [Thermoleophilia bacterium]|nr:glycosyltransferase family 2 protein [Thermoleophilia bacterium]